MVASSPQNSDDIALPATPESESTENADVDVPATATETASKEAESTETEDAILDGETDDVVPAFGDYSTGKLIFGGLLVLAVPVGLFFALGGMRFVKRLVAGRNARGRYRKVDDEEK